MKKILIISEYHLIKTFVLPTITKLKSEKEFIIDCFVLNDINEEKKIELKNIFNKVYSINTNIVLNRIPKFRTFFFWINLIKSFSKVGYYDIIHINYLHYFLIVLLNSIRKKTDKLFISFYGSDFNTDKKYRHLINEVMVKKADSIFVTSNPTFLKKIISKYSVTEKKQQAVLIPLFPTFEIFEKYLQQNSSSQAKHKLSISKPIITCAYNASRIGKHIEIIESLHNIEDRLQGYKILFPMAYGQDAEKYRKEISDKLLVTKLDHQILAEYLSPNQINTLRLATDIFIHMQTKDQMAASFLEHLAAGSIVITGKWLPYDWLKEMGIFFIDIENIDMLCEKTIEVISNLSYFKNKAIGNREKILNIMKWENNKINWYRYYGIS